jgi:hypothetical protein
MGMREDFKAKNLAIRRLRVKTPNVYAGYLIRGCAIKEILLNKSHNFYLLFIFSTFYNFEETLLDSCSPVGRLPDDIIR